MAYFSAHHRPDKAIGLMQPRELLLAPGDTKHNGRETTKSIRNQVLSRIQRLPKCICLFFAWGVRLHHHTAHMLHGSSDNRHAPFPWQVAHVTLVPSPSPAMRKSQT